MVCAVVCQSYILSVIPGLQSVLAHAFFLKQPVFSEQLSLYNQVTSEYIVQEQHDFH